MCPSHSNTISYSHTSHCQWILRPKFEYLSYNTRCGWWWRGAGNFRSSTLYSMCLSYLIPMTLVISQFSSFILLFLGCCLRERMSGFKARTTMVASLLHAERVDGGESRSTSNAVIDPIVVCLIFTLIDNNNVYPTHLLISTSLIHWWNAANNMSEYRNRRQK